MQYCSLGPMKVDHFLLSTGYAPVNITKDDISLACCQGTWVVHIQLTICQEPQMPFSRAATQPFSASGYALPSVALGISPCRIL